LPGELYPRGLADSHRLDLTPAGETERLTVRSSAVVALPFT
jgi:hypothetical protein